MVEEKKAEGGGEARLAGELKRMAAEPLLPAEKKLIAWSLVLGVVLLALLLILSRVLFPPAPPPGAPGAGGAPPPAARGAP